VEATPLKTYIKRPETCVDAVTVYERTQVVAQQMKAATWGANGLILGHPRNQLQSFDAKTLAIFVPADSALAVRACARQSARH
jgi:hypothetical protein